MGKIPDIFLRGAGIPNVFLEYATSLVAIPFEFYSCFISYSHVDKSFARRVHDTLQGRGIRCWLDEKQLFPGDHIHREIDEAVRLWDKVLLCCSEKSLTSWWVDKEVEQGPQKGGAGSGRSAASPCWPSSPSTWTATCLTHNGRTGRSSTSRTGWRRTSPAGKRTVRSSRNRSAGAQGPPGGCRRAAAAAQSRL